MVQENLSAFLEIRRLAAIPLLRAAAIIVAQEKAAYRSAPPHSKDGEHLRGVTWNARDNLVYSPTTPEDVAALGHVKIGYREVAWYAAWWEASGRRVGLFKRLQGLQGSGAFAKISGTMV